MMYYFQQWERTLEFMFRNKEEAMQASLTWAVSWFIVDFSSLGENDSGIVYTTIRLYAQKHSNFSL